MISDKVFINLIYLFKSDNKVSILFVRKETVGFKDNDEVMYNLMARI